MGKKVGSGGEAFLQKAFSSLDAAEHQLTRMASPDAGSLLAGVPDMVGRGGAAMAKRRVSPPLVFEGDVGLWT